MSLRRLLVLFVVAALAAAAGVSAWVWNAYEKALPMPGERVEFRIAPGASTRAIARQLQAAGIDINETLFVIAARATRVTQSLRAGRYEILRGASLHQLLDKLRAGDTLRERITLIEGWTLRDLRAALAADPDLRHDSAAMSESDRQGARNQLAHRHERIARPGREEHEDGAHVGAQLGV